VEEVTDTVRGFGEDLLRGGLDHGDIFSAKKIR
jgi:hypothetical protein